MKCATKQLVIIFLNVSLTTICYFLSNRYSSGGEDGYVRIHTFDPQFNDFEFEY